jgi:hypothetical protein
MTNLLQSGRAEIGRIDHGIGVRAPWRRPATRTTRVPAARGSGRGDPPPPSRPRLRRVPDQLDELPAASGDAPVVLELPHGGAELIGAVMPSLKVAGASA